MFKHEITFSLPAHGANPTHIVVKRKGATAGTLVITNKGFEWYETNSKEGLSVNWGRFRKLMNEYG